MAQQAGLEEAPAIVKSPERRLETKQRGLPNAGTVESSGSVKKSRRLTDALGPSTPVRGRTRSEIRGPETGTRTGRKADGVVASDGRRPLRKSRQDLSKASRCSVLTRTSRLGALPEWLRESCRVGDAAHPQSSGGLERRQCPRTSGQQGFSIVSSSTIGRESKGSRRRRTKRPRLEPSMVRHSSQFFCPPRSLSRAFGGTAELTSSGRTGTLGLPTGRVLLPRPGWSQRSDHEPRSDWGSLPGTRAG